MFSFGSVDIMDGWIGAFAEWIPVGYQLLA
jgi:hypothetical protein